MSDDLREMMERVAKRTGEKIQPKKERPSPRDVVMNARMFSDRTLTGMIKRGNLAGAVMLKNPVQMMNLWGQDWDLRPCDIVTINAYCKKMGYDPLRPSETK